MTSSTFLVVIPAYNAAEFLRDAIDGMLRQTLPRWTCVIVDDGSTDGKTPQLVDSLAGEDPRIGVIHQANTGLPGARNAGWRRSRTDTDYLYFLDADDIPEPDALEAVGAYLDSHPEAACVYGQPLYWHPGFPADDYLEPMPRFEQHGIRMEPVAPDEPLVTLRTLAANPVIIPSATFFRRSVFERTGGWDSELNRMCEDIDMSLNIALHGQVHFMNRQLIRYRRHGANMSLDSARWWAGYKQMRAKWERRLGNDPEHAAELADALTFADLYACHRSWHGMRGSLRQRKPAAAFRFVAQGLREAAEYALNRAKRRKHLISNIRLNPAKQ